MERGLLVSELRGSLLGPRGGIEERIPKTDGGPDYILGFLDPPGKSGTTLSEEFISSSVRESADPTDPGETTLIDSTVDGKPPSTMGISFIVEGVNPRVDICLTWSRYVLNGEEFERIPHHHIIDGLELDKSRTLTKRLDPDRDLELLVKTKPIKERDGFYRTSAFLVNRTSDESSITAMRVFQPQIRINLGEGASLKSVTRTKSDSQDQDSESLDLLYRNKVSLARGHLVSATWKDLDPEAFSIDGPNKTFQWVDGGLLERDDRLRFTCPDLRTEYLPSVPIISPDLDNWAGFSESPPMLNSKEIAQANSIKSLRDGLKQLTDGYSKWITLTEEAGRSLARFPDVIDRHMNQCKESLRGSKRALTWCALTRM